MIKAIVVRVAGTNCDNETVFALKKAGFETDSLHINQIIKEKTTLEQAQLLVFPGGFSYGDYLGSAKVFANQLKLKLKEPLEKFIEEKKLMLGICNGFQALVKAGLLPANKGLWEQTVSLTFNSSGHFQDQWVTLEIVSDKSPFVKGIEEMECPINHGEGRFVVENKKTLQELYENMQVVFKYKENPNGSLDSIAAISSYDGLVFGIMPHPEKHVFSQNHPQSTRKEMPENGKGLKIFQNAFDYLKK